MALEEQKMGLSISPSGRFYYRFSSLWGNYSFRWLRPRNTFNARETAMLPPAMVHGP